MGGRSRGGRPSPAVLRRAHQRGPPTADPRGARHGPRSPARRPGASCDGPTTPAATTTSPSWWSTSSSARTTVHAPTPSSRGGRPTATGAAPVGGVPSGDGRRPAGRPPSRSTPPDPRGGLISRAAPDRPGPRASRARRPPDAERRAGGRRITLPRPVLLRRRCLGALVCGGRRLRRDRVVRHQLVLRRAQRQPSSSIYQGRPGGIPAASSPRSSTAPASPLPRCWPHRGCRRPAARRSQEPRLAHGRPTTCATCDAQRARARRPALHTSTPAAEPRRRRAGRRRRARRRPLMERRIRWLGVGMVAAASWRCSCSSTTSRS